jgi:type I restriction enzyme M protein
MQTMSHQALSSFTIWVADRHRGRYRQTQYGKVIIPLTILRCMHCVLEVTKPTMLSELVTINRTGLKSGPVLRRNTEQAVYKTRNWTW